MEDWLDKADETKRQEAIDSKQRFDAQQEVLSARFEKARAAWLLAVKEYDNVIRPLVNDVAEKLSSELSTRFPAFVGKAVFNSTFEYMWLDRNRGDEHLGERPGLSETDPLYTVMASWRIQLECSPYKEPLLIYVEMRLLCYTEAKVTEENGEVWWQHDFVPWLTEAGEPVYDVPVEIYVNWLGGKDSTAKKANLLSDSEVIFRTVKDGLANAYIASKQVMNSFKLSPARLLGLMFWRVGLGILGLYWLIAGGSFLKILGVAGIVIASLTIRSGLRWLRFDLFKHIGISPNSYRHEWYRKSRPIASSVE